MSQPPISPPPVSQPPISQPPGGLSSSPADPISAAATPRPRAPLTTLFWIFFQIGALSFGGGLAAWVHREVVLKRGWMSETEFLTGLALCQVLPGVNVVNLAVHVGQRLRGALGALTCTVAIVFVPFFAVIGLASVYDYVKDIGWVHDFLDGVAVAAVGLLVSVALRSVRGTFKNLAPYAAALALIVTVGILHWPMIPVVLCVAPLSILAAWLTRARPAGGA